MPALTSTGSARVCSAGVIDLEGGTSARTTSTGTSTARRAETAGTAEFIVAVLGLLTLLEGGEAVGERQHAVATEGVVHGILDVVGSDVAVNVLSSVEDIAFVNLTSRDVVRHPLVQKIVKAYEDYEKHGRFEHRYPNRRKV